MTAAIVLAVASAAPAPDGGRASNFAVVPPPLAVLAFLGTVALGLLLLAASAYFALRSRPAWARRGLLAAVGLGALYGAALVGLGLASEEVTLPVGGEKGFCEMDCHLVYSVDSVERIASSGGVPAGEIWSVALRTRFDESTIASFRSREAPVLAELLLRLGRGRRQRVARAISQRRERATARARGRLGMGSTASPRGELSDPSRLRPAARAAPASAAGDRPRVGLPSPARQRDGALAREGVAAPARRSQVSPSWRAAGPP